MRNKIVNLPNIRGYTLMQFQDNITSRIYLL